MAYKVPAFPLLCRIYQAQAPGPFPLSGGVTSPCQLQINKSGLLAFAGGTGGGTAVLLLLPKGTDVRPSHTSAAGDAVQVPDGSGEYYAVSAVNDVAKGFPNEYRICVLSLLTQKANATAWPMP